MKTNSDYVYYLKVEGELLEPCFSDEGEAHEYAEMHEVFDYEVVEWDVA